MATKYTPYRLIPFSRVVLHKLYICHLEIDSKSEFGVGDLIESFSSPISRNLLVSALEFLRNKNYNRESLISRRPLGNGLYVYRIMPEGFRVIEDALRSRNSDLAYLHENGDEVISEIAGINGTFVTREDVINHDPWSPLPIDREDSTYIEAVTDVEEALEIIRGDNGFAASHPNEREGILATLEEGLSWLKDRSPTRSQIFALMISPLQWLATNFSKAIIGEAAKKAAQSLIDLLHSFF